MENTQKNIVDELKPEELPDLLRWYEGMLQFYDGESKEVRETLCSQILLTKNKLNQIQDEGVGDNS